MALPEESGYSISEDPIYEDGQISRYATEDPTVFIEFFRELSPASSSTQSDLRSYLNSYDSFRTELMDRGLQAYIPEVIDSDEEDLWVAFGLEEGAYSLVEVANHRSEGLDGRDWAWMLRRVLMVLEAGGRQPNLDERNFLVYPSAHGIVILGWQPQPDPTLYPLDQLTELMVDYLVEAKDADELIHLVRGFSKAFRSNRDGQSQLKIDPDGSLFSYQNALDELTFKLSRLYGHPSFHELELDPEAAVYLDAESRAVRAALEL